MLARRFRVPIPGPVVGHDVDEIQVLENGVRDLIPAVPLRESRCQQFPLGLQGLGAVVDERPIVFANGGAFDVHIQPVEPVPADVLGDLRDEAGPLGIPEQVGIPAEQGLVAGSRSAPDGDQDRDVVGVRLRDQDGFLVVKREVPLFVHGVLEGDVDVRDLCVVNGLRERGQVHPMRDIGDHFERGRGGCVFSVCHGGGQGKSEGSEAVVDTAQEHLLVWGERRRGRLAAR